MLTKGLIQKFNVKGPRYTSYPTANEWEEGFEESHYCKSLKNAENASLSLYFHLPFCEKMCYYCGCNVVIRKFKPEVSELYLSYLHKEMALLLGYFSTKPLVKQLHFGGGTPNFFTADQLNRLYASIHQQFNISKEAEIAIEIDPRVTTLDHLQVLKSWGVNRLSMGLQDFDPIVQKAVNRIQPFEMTKSLVLSSRSLGFDSLNIDLIYGLPYQTVTSFLKTIDFIKTLNPDRIALYSYAHVPWLKSHQQLIKAQDLPDADSKLDIFISARNALLEAGYMSIAMDHFALKTDDMALAFQKNQLYRNFMGYTLKPADHFLGLGVSAIGHLSSTFVQNTRDLGVYYKQLDEGKLPVSRGLVLTEDDQIRQWVIQELMCHFKLDKSDFIKKTGRPFDVYFSFEMTHLAQCEQDGLLILDQTGISITPLGKLFIRNICMGFDIYLRKNTQKNQFSSTI